MCVEARLAEMHLGVDHAGQHVQARAVDPLGRASARDRSPIAAMAPSRMPTSRRAAAVLIDDGAALENEIEGLGHAALLAVAETGAYCARLLMCLHQRIGNAHAERKLAAQFDGDADASRKPHGPWRRPRSGR